MNEVVLIGKPRDILFNEDIIQKTIEKVKNFSYENKTFFQWDYEKDKNRP